MQYSPPGRACPDEIGRQGWVCSEPGIKTKEQRTMNKDKDKGFMQ